MEKRIQENRSYFPRGLRQPSHGERFSVDSLLLACYPGIPRQGRFLELGAGCGAVSLGLLLRAEESGLTGLGVDLDPEMVEAAAENAHSLGLEDRFRAEGCDVRQVRKSWLIPPESFDLVLANPPYRGRSQGRLSPSGGRRDARTEVRAELGDFVRAASYAVKNKGQVYLIYLAERLQLLLQELASARLEPKRLRQVQGKPGRSARQVLVEARKNAGPGLELEPPLILHQDGDSSLTRQALRFCPFLECNP